MGHHINAKGQFQSDKYTDLAPDKIVLSFKDPAAKKPLILYCQMCWGQDEELARDIMERLGSMEKEEG